MMRVIVEYNGVKYESIEYTKLSVKEITDIIYKNMSKLSVIKMELKNGGYLVMGKDAVQSAIFTIIS